MIKAILTTMPFFTSLFWGVLILITSKRNEKSKKALAFFMFVASMLYLCHCAYFNGESSIIPISDTIYTFSTLSVFPIYYFYIIHLTSENSISKSQLLFLLPSVICSIIIGITYYLMPTNEKVLWTSEYLFGITSESSFWIGIHRAMHKIVSICFCIEIPPIAILGTKRIRCFNRLINNNYSNTEGKTLSRFTWFLFLFIVTSIMSGIVDIIGKEHFVDSIWLLMIPSLFFSILLFFLGFIGFIQNFTISNYSTENDNEELYTTSNDDSLLSQMTLLMNNEKLYLKPNLKINDVALKLCTNRTYVSKTINTELGITFCEWINQYRVEHAQQLLLESKNTKNNLNIKDIYLQSGFVSEASFFRIFKRRTGVSPRSWMKS